MKKSVITALVIAVAATTLSASPAGNSIALNQRTKAAAPRPNNAFRLHPTTTILDSDGVTVPASIERTLPVVDVVIAGNKYRFAFDPSVKCSAVVDKSVAKRLSLKVKTHERLADGAGHTNRYAVVGIDSLRLASAKFNDVDAVVDDLTPFKVDGILGYGLFSSVLLTVDFPRSELRLISGSLPEPDGASVLPLTNEGGVPAVVINAAGKPVFAAINFEVSAALLVTPAVAKDVSGAAMSGNTHGQLSGDLRLGSVSLPNSGFIVRDGFRFPAIGYGFLKQTAITFDAANKRLKVEGV